jgi:membrane protein DedA with SNARE-associated domain
MPRHDFLVANAVGAALWAVLIGGLGYLAGHAVEAMLGHVAGAERLVLIAVVVVGVVALLVRSARRRRARPGAGPVNHD